jgi:hypothetical protein
MRLRDLIRAVENKYNRFLTILVFIYLSSPFLLDWSIGSFIVASIFLGAITLVAYQIQHSRKTLRLYIGLVFLSLLLQALSYLPSTSLNFDRLFETLSKIIFLAFLGLSIYLIVRELTIAEQVTADIIKGGICVYFLFGFSWAILYDIVYSFDINSFNAATTPLTRADLTHFSFTTLTTVGYGDISPASEIARVLANLEGMVGVMYPTIFIARLVSLHSNR